VPTDLDLPAATTRTSPQPSGSLASAWRHLTVFPGLVGSVLCVAGAVLLVLSGLIHLHLWDTGYRHIATIGPLFLVQGVVGILVALAVAALRWPVIALAGALFAAGTVGGLVLSVEVGLFGFRDSFSAPYATVSLVLESVAVVVLLAAAVVGLTHRTADAGQARRGSPR
jgi:hypothetical protein